MTIQKTLLLNSSFHPLKAISWERAVCMHFLEKVDVLACYDKTVSSATTSMQVPAVVRLRHHVTVHPTGIRFSRRNIYVRDEHTCQYCMGEFHFNDLTLDHVIPRSMGGRTTWSNIVTCCKDCNWKKADKTPNQAGMKLLKKPKTPTVKNFYQMHNRDIPEEWQGWIF